MDENNRWIKVIRSRRHFAANIKTILTGRDQNCHAKHREALILNPLWRMSLSLNDDPERLQVLPPLDIDVRDKIIVLKVIKARMTMSTGSPELDARFWNQLMLEMPAFLHHLEQWQVPNELADSRYGITPYQHPEIVEKLEQTTPELGCWNSSTARYSTTLLRRSTMLVLNRGRGAQRLWRLDWSTRRARSSMKPASSSPGRIHVGLTLRALKILKTSISPVVLPAISGNGQTVWTIRPPRCPEAVPESNGGQSRARMVPRPHLPRLV